MKDLPHDDFSDRDFLPELPEDAIWIGQWRKMGCRRALDRLLRAHSGRIRAMARSWSRGLALQDDLVSEGMLALIDCLEGYVPRANVPFFAYARPFVRAAMRRAYYRDAAIVTVPLHRIRVQTGAAQDEAWFRAATTPERLDVEDALELEADCDTGEAALIRSEVELGRRRALETALAALSETDRRFVERRREGGGGDLFDLDPPSGLTPSRALRMEARALARLRTQLILGGVTSADAGIGS